MKPGTHYNHRMAAGQENPPVRARVVLSTDLCVCGHPAIKHDLDRTVVLDSGPAPINGVGCLDEWTETKRGCDCNQFRLRNGGVPQHVRETS